MTIKIALTNLGKYNEGTLVYEWLDLPATEEEIHVTLKSIGIGRVYEEYFISDYETDIEGLEIGEYENLTNLNELAERVETLEEYELIDLGAIMEVITEGLERALEILKDGDYSFYEGIHTEAELGEYVVDEGLFGIEVPDSLKNYLNYEAIGRDWSMNGAFAAHGYIEIH